MISSQKVESDSEFIPSTRAKMYSSNLRASLIELQSIPDVSQVVADTVAAAQASSKEDTEDQQQVLSASATVDQTARIKTQYDSGQIGAAEYDAKMTKSLENRGSCEAQFDACERNANRWHDACLKAMASTTPGTARSERFDFFDKLDDIMDEMIDQNSATGGSSLGGDAAPDDEQEGDPGPDSPLEPSDVTNSQQMLMDQAVANMNEMSS